MLYFPTQTLAAIENDRLRAAARYRLRAKVRREQATLVPKRRGLAGQPFKRAMGAAMNHRIDLFMLAEPDIEGDVGMARW